MQFGLIFALIVLSSISICIDGGTKVHITPKSKKGTKTGYDFMKKDKKANVIMEEAILQRKRRVNSLECVDNHPSSDEGVVTISSFKADSLGLQDGEVIRLKGKRHKETVAVLNTDDKLDKNSIRTSRSIRANLRVLEGDMIDIEPAAPVLASDKRGKAVKKGVIRTASRVEVLPFRESIPDLDSIDLFEAHVKPHFLSQQVVQRPVMLGDIFVSPAGGEFQVVDVEWASVEATGAKAKKAKKRKAQPEEMEGDGQADDEEPQEGSIALVGADTEIVWDGPPIERQEDLRSSEVGYDDVGGCRTAMASIRELVELPLRHPEVFTSIGIPAPRGVLLHGPSGTGKTSLARAVAAETGAYFFVLNGPDIMSKRSGESESKLRDAFAEAEKHSPAIIFIDEIDAIAPKRDKAAGETEKRVVSQLLTLFDGIKRSANVVVVAATNRPNEIDPALRRFGRFDRELHISQPDEDGRLEILRIKTKGMQLASDCDLATVAKNTHGYVGADLSAVCMEAAFRAIREIMPYFDVDTDPEDVDPALYKNIRITNGHFEAAVDATNPSSLRENIAEVPDTKWADIGGLEDVKRELRELVQLPVEYSHLYEKFGMKSSKGVLFYGPPGCGKTLLAKAIANEAGANFISIKGPELLDAHIGESEANVRALFDKARAASPCILFFDEIDSIAKARSGGSHGSGLGDNVINQILTEIDSVEETKSVFIIGATNRPDILDSSVTRPGHLDQLVYIPLPDYESRLSIFQANLRKCPIDADVDLKKLARSTEGFSGADITEICQRAAKNAIREDIVADKMRAAEELEDSGYDEDLLKKFPGVQRIRRDHFEDAMNRARRSVSDADVERYKQFITKQQNDASEAVSFTFEAAAAKFAAESADMQDLDDDDDSLYK